jgi:polyphosphate kinase
MTANEEITHDVSRSFQAADRPGQGTNAEAPVAGAVHAAFPMWSAIQAEADAARSGGKGRIVAKMNSLVEPEVINALYEASQAGVDDRPDRSRRLHACARRDRGCRRTFASARSSAVSSNTTASSTSTPVARKRLPVERRLDGAQLLQAHRTRLPHPRPKLKKRVITEGLKFYLADNQQGWEMNSVGAYQRRRSARAKPHNAQGELMVTWAAAKAGPKQSFF